jgi:CRP-like cAMP-binding protein
MDPAPRDFARRFPAVAELLTDTELAALASSLTRRSIAAGDLLVTEGRASDAVFFLWDGSLAVRLSSDGDAREIGRCEPGAVVGEISFLDGGPATATLAASSPVTVLGMSRDHLERLRVSHPRAATAVLRALCRSLAERVRKASDVLEKLAHPSAGESNGVGWIEAFRVLFGFGE